MTVLGRVLAGVTLLGSLCLAGPARAEPRPALKSGLDLQLSLDPRLLADLRSQLEAPPAGEHGRDPPTAVRPELIRYDLLAVPRPAELRPTGPPVGLLIGAAGVQAAALAVGALVPIPRPGELTSKMPQQLARAGALAAAAAAATYTEELFKRLLGRAR